MWCLCLWRCIALLALSRSHSSPLDFSCFFFYSITLLVHFPLCSSSHSLSPPFSVTLFLLCSPICSHCLTHRIYCKLLYLSFSPPPLSLISFLNVSLSSSSQWISCCRPELKVTCWLGHGLQHRTWVLPLLPARVLCCSQWSCLSASLPVCLPAAAGLSSPNSWIPPTVDLLTLLLTLRLARTLSLSFKV